jgi:hypothetical protein
LIGRIGKICERSSPRVSEGSPEMEKDGGAVPRWSTAAVFLRPLALTEVRTRSGTTGRGRIHGRYSRFHPGTTQRGGWRGAACKGASEARVVADLLRDKIKRGVGRCAWVS